jgi:tRNA threonylcarbamoyladenosine biosynthesis protein TsaE
MTIEVTDESMMKELGQALGTQLRGGEVIELVGDVGAGKTTFTKGLAVGLGVDEDVQSPSFTISRVYDGRDELRLAHYDFYRLLDAGIMAHDLEESVGDPATITIIEWADVVKTILPEEYLEIRFSSPTESTRVLQVNPRGARYQSMELAL